MKPVNRSLLARTKPEFYTAFREHARQCGASEEDVERMIASDIARAQTLLDGKCPECGAPIARYIDHKRQQGASAVPGTWVQYRCSTSPPPGKSGPRPCGFMIDLKEGDEAN